MENVAHSLTDRAFAEMLQEEEIANYERQKSLDQTPSAPASSVNSLSSTNRRHRRNLSSPPQPSAPSRAQNAAENRSSVSVFHFCLELFIISYIYYFPGHLLADGLLQCSPCKLFTYFQIVHS